MINYLEISTIKKWEKSTQELTDLFVEKYFDKDADYYWIGDCLGDISYVNDFFFDLNDMVDFLKYGYTQKQMFDYYDYRLKSQERADTIMNIKNWIKLK